MKIEREYYPLAGAAKRLGCNEDDLIHLAAIGKLCIWSMLDRVVSVNSLPKSNGFPDFSANWIYGENGWCGSVDFVKLENGYFRRIEAGITEPEIVAFEVDGIEGEVFFLGQGQSLPRVRYFIKRHDIERMERDDILRMVRDYIQWKKRDDIRRMERAEVYRSLQEGMRLKELAPLPERDDKPLVTTMPAGATFAKLRKALESFDTNKLPRSKKEFMGNLESLGCDTREQVVFSKIVAENYGHEWRS